MLTGKPTFDAEDTADTLALVLKGEPDWSRLSSDVPRPILTLVRSCLEKDRRQRIADVSTALFVLRTHGDLAVAPTTARPRTLGQRQVGIAAILCLTAAAVAAGAAWLASRSAAPRVTRTTISVADTEVSIDGNDRDVALTPDGSRVIYVSGSHLLVRPLDALEPTSIATLNGGAQGIFTSLDGQWVGYVENNTLLKKVAVTGGPPVALLTMDTNSRGVTWTANDILVFATSESATGLQSVPAAGGTVTVITRPDATHGEADHLWPEVLPGGHKVLFTITAVNGGLDAAQIAVLDLDTGSRKTLIRGGSHAHYAASGHLVYGASGTLRAVAFDPDRLEVRGVPVPVVPRLVTTGVGAADFGIANDGTLVYVDYPGFSGADDRTLVWVDRKGVERSLGAPPRQYQFPRLSPDGTRVALFVNYQDLDLWIWDLMRATLTRLTTDSAFDGFPTWTPDGQHLVFESARAGPPGLYIQATDGASPAIRLTSSTNTQAPSGISPDGTRVVFSESVPPNQLPDLRLLTLPPLRPSRATGPPPGDASAAPSDVKTLFESRFAERNGVISPDGRWLAYDANPSGQFEIYVRPFPNTSGGQWQVSSGGGRQPLWARRGGELFYVAPDGALMAVTTAVQGERWNAGSPTKLFDAGAVYSDASGFLNRMYDVAPDDQHFLILKRGSDQRRTLPQIVVVEHWFEELKRLVPTK